MATRTLTTGCGWSTNGSVREVNGKLKLHSRVCVFCKEIDLGKYEKPNKKQGEKNGINAVRINAKGFPVKQPNQTKIVSVEDRSFEVEVSNILSARTVLELVKLTTEMN